MVVIAGVIGAFYSFGFQHYLSLDSLRKSEASLKHMYEMAFPFFVIDLAMGLTPMHVRTYFLVSLVGMIPGNILYVNAGVQFGKIQSLSDLLSPGLIASFVALGVFPLIVKKFVDFWRKRHGQSE